MSTPLLIQMSIEKNDDKGIMKILRKEGAKESELYVQVLTYFVQRTITQQNSSKGMRSALNSLHISYGL